MAISNGIMLITNWKCQQGYKILLAGYSIESHGSAFSSGGNYVNKKVHGPTSRPDGLKREDSIKWEYHATFWNFFSKARDERNRWTITIEVNAAGECALQQLYDDFVASQTSGCAVEISLYDNPIDAARRIGVLPAAALPAPTTKEEPKTVVAENVQTVTDEADPLKALKDHIEHVEKGVAGQLQDFEHRITGVEATVGAIKSGMLTKAELNHGIVVGFTKLMNDMDQRYVRRSTPKKGRGAEETQATQELIEEAAGVS